MTEQCERKHEVTMKNTPLRLVPILTLAMAGCAVGPNYKRPTTTTPEHYKAEAFGLWKEGHPVDSTPKGDWWHIFGDGTLNDLQSRALGANQDLKAAMARVEQARATARVVGSELLPTINADPSSTRQRFSANQVPSFGVVTVNNYRAPLDLSYEIDLWGRVRRGFEGARADAQASVAAFHNVLLVLNAEVAQNYFALRALDAEISIVARTLELRKNQVLLVKDRFKRGIGNDLDVARAETELATTEAEAASLAKRRAELENTLAILVGENPSAYNFPVASSNGGKIWNPSPPKIPAGLPADLLERRPDVGEAERQLAAANARIGVAKAAFFPVLSLTASGGYVSGDIDTLFNWPSHVWSIGPSLSLPIFAGGRNLAHYNRSKAAFEEATARYRQSILVAFGDVENSLAGIRFLTDEAAAQDRAVANSRRAAELAGERYRSGIASYFEVIDADSAALQAERAKAQLAGELLIASVHLIKALGGGWRAQGD